MPQSNHRKKGGGINEREPSAFIAYTYDSKTMPPCKIQSAKAKHKVLDEITGFARSRHPVKVYCYQWTTSNYSKERASDHLAIQQFTKVHSGCSPSLSYSITASLPCQQFSQTFSSLPHRKIQRLH